MRLTGQEWWALIHGVVLGGLYLLAFAGGLAELYGLRPHLVTAQGLRARIRRLKIGTATMATVTWLTDITGTWIVYPWYRDPAPGSPRSRLLASESTAGWHEFAMEWKEHIAWISPILATAVVFIVFSLDADLVHHERARRTAMTLFVLAFVFAAVAGLLGALITKAAPVA
ncbi:MULTISPECIES: hypothetical protein [Streptosporangium]|uniref:Uncharacterized protein n=1 Tax=Streptosporangium brasiliense TaxID=47480 RepID=A0ABT9RHN6_9ACTN|nr:hypothetical protein [Streptosporangium brasiliense]MDP9868796.1 hypothetical protein [Streptosporangium brasiliense]